MILVLRSVIFVSNSFIAFNVNTLSVFESIISLTAFKSSKTAKVYINFVVDEDGNILDVKSLKPAGFGFDEEGIRLVSSMSKAFIPGMQKGKKVKVKFVIPINFDLN